MDPPFLPFPFLFPFIFWALEPPLAPPTFPFAIWISNAFPVLSLVGRLQCLVVLGRADLHHFGIASALPQSLPSHPPSSLPKRKPPTDDRAREMVGPIDDGLKSRRNHLSCPSFIKHLHQRQPLNLSHFVAKLVWLFENPAVGAQQPSLCRHLQRSTDRPKTQLVTHDASARTSATMAMPPRRRR